MVTLGIDAPASEYNVFESQCSINAHMACHLAVCVGAS